MAWRALQNPLSVSWLLSCRRGGAGRLGRLGRLPSAANGTANTQATCCQLKQRGRVEWCAVCPRRASRASRAPSTLLSLNKTSVTP